MMTQPQIPEELQPEALRWFTYLDNHEPPRDDTEGTATSYDLPENRRGIRLERGIGLLRDPEKALYVIDSIESVQAYYVVGWHTGEPSAAFPEGHDPYVLLHPFPVGENFRGWAVGPRRAYHLKIWREP